MRSVNPRRDEDEAAGAPRGGPERAKPPELVDVSEGWAQAARCRSEDAALFFGPNRFEPKRERLAREDAAKAVCQACPALAACREHALANQEFYGVWGGLGENDRRAMLDGLPDVAAAV